GELWVWGEGVGRGAESGITGVPLQIALSRDFVPSHRPEAERRQITAMSCEAIGLAAQAEGIGLEDLAEAIGAFQHCVSEITGRHNGVFAGRLRDNVLFLFCYPPAHAHDARRALRAPRVFCVP